MRDLDSGFILRVSSADHNAMTEFRMDDIYKNTPPEDIPWNITEPPKTLVDLVGTGKVRPGRALDLGCGAGNYAIYLAGQGFDVTGVDLSPAAIKMAEENRRKKGVSCFSLRPGYLMVMGLLGAVSTIIKEED